MDVLAEGAHFWFSKDAAGHIRIDDVQRGQPFWIHSLVVKEEAKAGSFLVLRLQIPLEFTNEEIVIKRSLPLKKREGQLYASTYISKEDWESL